MNARLIEIGIRRGRLLERIAAQRATLGTELRPLGAALQGADRALDKLRSTGDCLKAHPGTVAAAVALLVALKPSRVWRWSKRGFVAWRTWLALRRQADYFIRRSGL